MFMELTEHHAAHLKPRGSAWTYKRVRATRGRLTGQLATTAPLTGLTVSASQLAPLSPVHTKSTPLPSQSLSSYCTAELEVVGGGESIQSMR